MARAILVASTGGHLTELIELSDRLDPAPDDVLWVTHESPQSRSLLAGRNVVFVPDLPQRAVWKVLKALPGAARIVRTFKPDMVVSTGAAVALVYLPVARLLGVSSRYVESAARLTGPSLTARILRGFPGIRVYGQANAFRGSGWGTVSSVFDGFAADHETPNQLPATLRVFVTTGTMDHYPFTRLVDRVAGLLPDNSEVVWQVAGFSGTDLPGRVVGMMPADEFEREVQKADVVISHAGAGSVLTALRAGKCPVVVPRRASAGEHVDDHQVEIANGLGSAGLVVAREIEGLDLAALNEAATTRITRTNETRIHLS